MFVLCRCVSAADLREAMDPDVTRRHPCSPPPPEDGGDDEEDDGRVGSGEFGGGSAASCSPLSAAASTEPVTTPAPPPPSSSSNLPAEQCQPASSGNSGSDRERADVKGQGYVASLRLENGFSTKEYDSGNRRGSCPEGAFSPEEETGFADFTVFTDQAAHPWCCGFSPISSTEQLGERVEGLTLSEKVCDPGQEAILDSEPRSHCARERKADVYTKFRHCEKGGPASGEPSQDHHQPQGAAAAFDFHPAESHLWEEDEGKPVDRWQEGGHCLDEAEDAGDGIFSNVPHAFSMYNNASEDLGSFGDDFSFEGVSADLEPNVSSLASNEDQTDWDKTDDEDEELGDCKLSDSVNSSMGDLRQSEAGNALNLCKQSATQETPAASSLCGPQLNSVAKTAGQFSAFNHSSSEGQRDPAHADARVENLGSLPPSDSFADFCSAPTQEDGDGSWVEFKEQRTQEDSKSRTQLTEKVSRLRADEDAEQEQEQEQAGQCRSVRRNSCQASLLYRVQQLLLDTFPETVGTAPDDELLLSLDALLHTQHLPERREEEKEVSSGQWKQGGLWWPQQDIHSAVGLQFQWKGSHTNRTLLSCLGVDTRNIVFVGLKKQPVTVPAFASGLGLLEPTKDFVPAILSSQYPAVTAQTPPRPRATPDPSTASVQEALPSRQLGWSSRGLSSSQDDCSALNLDFFGTEEENRSSSNSPPSGLDPDLYELTITKVEPTHNSCHLENTMNRLMSTAVRTSTTIRKPQQDEELSTEAGRVIENLPNLSFMNAKVLMFPSILVSKECSAE
ncbi:aftiphilin isoform X2 [Betta splendens]|uniref:Aftiphilin isoform X2 n=1 Tax=Betta splendens TaxID=158456 RepID=A0A6P7KLI6_BETSP|nr:aftiphilin isoform X2 [Betta splendens]